MFTAAAPEPEVPEVLPPDEPVAPEDAPASPVLAPEVLPVELLLAEAPLLVVPALALVLVAVAPAVVEALPVQWPGAHSSVAGLQPATARTKTNTPRTRMWSEHVTSEEDPASSGSMEFAYSNNSTPAHGGPT